MQYPLAGNASLSVVLYRKLGRACRLADSGGCAIFYRRAFAAPADGPASDFDLRRVSGSGRCSRVCYRAIPELLDLVLVEVAMPVLMSHTEKTQYYGFLGLNASPVCVHLPMDCPQPERRYRRRFALAGSFADLIWFKCPE